jgi:protein arginine kinase
MKLSDLLYHTSEWLKGTGPRCDIVISSRIRLARNLEGIPFPHWANKEQSQQALSSIRQAIEKVDYLKKTVFFTMQELDNVDKHFLIERHLMSYEHAREPENKALVVDEEEIVAIMINEEDHIRMQVMQSGLNLFEAWNIINRIDDVLSQQLDIAFLQDWGYLTACPTNTGTGMRGSVMLHLPALVMTRQINRVLSAISKLSFAARGLYGEGTEASGNFFQISNQVSLGRSEEEIIDNINGVIRQVIEQELAARQTLLSRRRALLQDKIHRSLGILKNAYIVTSQEATELLSMVRLGCDLKIIKNISRQIINGLLVVTQPAHLQKIEGRRLTPQERDLKRAELIRSKLKEG